MNSLHLDARPHAKSIGDLFQAAISNHWTFRLQARLISVLMDVGATAQSLSSRRTAKPAAALVSEGDAIADLRVALSRLLAATAAPGKAGRGDGRH